MMNTTKDIMDNIMNKEIEERYDIADGCVAASDIEASIQNETEVDALFLEEPESYVPKNWMLDLFGKDKLVVDIESRDVDALVENFLDTLALLGVDAEVTIIGEI
ncbi:hypothetical protein ABK933_03600 [Klebsiella aerogenes]|uniref:hypothetical protein n=1 Tax=Klebsiella aerogenes TaxID=548 RepID=UPI002B26A36C|nr:hypothetical protein [Klebsiella aerogenes]MEA8782148.1 hypothetical protein [Klebsiella aerogenes]